MISKEQIAHDLAIVYLQNRYGVSINSNFFLMKELEQELLKLHIFLLL